MLPGGWWRTGDMGFFDSKYQVYNLSGRSKDMIIRGGENIQPTEIEDFYSGHPGIDDIYVVGVPSKRLGEEVCAYIRVRQIHSFKSDYVFISALGQISNRAIAKRARLEWFGQIQSAQVHCLCR